MVALEMASIHNVQWIDPTALRDLSIEPNWADVDPDHHRCLVIDLRRPATPAEIDVEEVCRWLARQPVPVLGLGDRDESPLGAAMDLVLGGEGELERALGSIEARPIAASVLVQVLRGVGALDVHSALALESMGYATLQAGREFAEWIAAVRVERPARSQPPRDDVVLMTRNGERLDLVLNSPETRNALSVPMRDALTDAFKLVAQDVSIARVEVSGNGPCFSAGGDLGEFGTVVDAAEAHRIRMLRMPAPYLALRAARYHFHLHGACIGAGIELPAFAGHLTAASDSYFQLPELGFGLIPGAGGCVSVSRRIGRQRTARMVILNEQVPSDVALRWGLIDAIVD